VSWVSAWAPMRVGGVVKIPKDYAFAHAALFGCGVITGVGAVFNAARVPRGSRVAVGGGGGNGWNAIQGAKLAGAAKVIGVDRVTSKLEDAKTMGATEVVDGSAGDAMEAVKALTGGKGVDFAIEAIGLPGSVEEAYGATKKGGTCVVVGIMPPEPRVEIDAHALVYAEKTLKGSLYGSARPRVDLLALMEMHRAGKLMLDELLTRTYELEEINEAYADLEAGKLARGLIVF
jgi:S-(hydroxymethyl)glutathione dehydrogenase/alcohol dehydrogenase